METIKLDFEEVGEQFQSIPRFTGMMNGRVIFETPSTGHASGIDIDDLDIEGRILHHDTITRRAFGSDEYADAHIAELERVKAVLNAMIDIRKSSAIRNCVFNY